MNERKSKVFFFNTIFPTWSGGSRNRKAGGQNYLLGSSIHWKENLEGFFDKNEEANFRVGQQMAVTPVENETYKVKAVLESMPIYTASAITAPIWVGDKIDELLRGVERSKEATLSELEYGQAQPSAPSY